LPVFGLASPEQDYSGKGQNFTLTNTPTLADHAPAGSMFGFGTMSPYAVAAAPPAGAIPRRMMIGAGL